MRRLLVLLVALPLFGCPEPPPPAATPTPTPEPTPEPTEVLPDVIPVTWLDGLSGSITHHQTYLNQGREGTVCDESFVANGANITAFQPDPPCDECELVFSLFLEQTVDCLGDDVLEENGNLGLDLRQAAGESVFWWYNEGLLGWFDGWDELGTGTVTQNVDDLTLDVHFEFEDPRNSDTGPSTSDTEDCGLFGNNRCIWNGVYIIDLQLALDPNLIEWDLEYPEE